MGRVDKDPGDPGIDVILDASGDLAIQGVRRGPEARKVEAVAGEVGCLDDLGRRGAGGVDHSLHEPGSAAVDHLVGQHRRDDLAMQPVAFYIGGKGLLHLGREIALQHVREIGLIRQGAVQQIVEQGNLGVGEQHADLRTGQRLASLIALRQFHIVRQALDRAVEMALGFQNGHQA